MGNIPGVLYSLFTPSALRHSVSGKLFSLRFCFSCGEGISHRECPSHQAQKVDYINVIFQASVIWWNQDLFLHACLTSFLIHIGSHHCKYL